MTCYILTSTNEAELHSHEKGACLDSASHDVLHCVSVSVHVSEAVHRRDDKEEGHGDTEGFDDEVMPVMLTKDRRERKG